MSKTPKKLSFVWEGYRFQWMEHSEQDDRKGAKLRSVKEYRVTHIRTRVFVGWFSDVEFAKRSLTRAATIDLIALFEQLENDFRCVYARVNQVTEQLNALRGVLFANVNHIKPDLRKAKSRP